jgi:hypothetical protein
MKRSHIAFALALALILSMGSAQSNATQQSCTDAYVSDVNDCSNLPNWVDRTACGAQALANYAECLARAIRGGGGPTM